MRKNRDCRGIFAAAAAVKCYYTQLVNQVFYLRENRDSCTIIAAAATKSDTYQLQ